MKVKVEEKPKEEVKVKVEEKPKEEVKVKVEEKPKEEVKVKVEEKPKEEDKVQVEEKLKVTKTKSKTKKDEKSKEETKEINDEVQKKPTEDTQQEVAKVKEEEKPSEETPKENEEELPPPPPPEDAQEIIEEQQEQKQPEPEEEPKHEEPQVEPETQSLSAETNEEVVSEPQPEAEEQPKLEEELKSSENLSDITSSSSAQTVLEDSEDKQTSQLDNSSLDTVKENPLRSSGEDSSLPSSSSHKDHSSHKRKEPHKIAASKSTRNARHSQHIHRDSIAASFSGTAPTEASIAGSQSSSSSHHRKTSSSSSSASGKVKVKPQSATAPLVVTASISKSPAARMFRGVLEELEEAIMQSEHTFLRILSKLLSLLLIYWFTAALVDVYLQPLYDFLKGKPESVKSFLVDLILDIKGLLDAQKSLVTLLADKKVLAEPLAAVHDTSLLFFITLKELHLVLVSF